MHCLIRQIILLFITLIFCTIASAQDYSYVQYDVQHGMAGANVYAIYQDPQKFLWFGTETGVSRFDGTHFKNFSTVDGLPDNEILEIYGDDDGRVWFVPFKKTICYYYKGKIYNQQNDSLLAKIQLHSNVLTVCQDKFKNTWLLEEGGLFLITADKKIHFYDKINGQLVNGPLFIGLNTKKELVLQWQDKVYIYTGHGFVLQFIINYPKEYRTFLSINIAGDFIVWRSGKNTTCAQSFTNQEMHCFEYPDNTLRFSNPGNGTISINTTNGAIIYDPLTKKTVYHFLRNVSVSKAMIDHEGSWWFTSLGDGAFQLISTNYNNFVPWEEGGNQEIFSLTKVGNKFLMGTNFSKLLYTSDFKKVDTLVLQASIKNKYNRISALYKTPANKIICGTDEILAVLDKNLKLEKYIPSNSVKSIHYINNDSLLVAASNNASLYNPVTLTQTKILWNERATAVALYKNTLFVGSLNGLYHLPANSFPVYMGDYDSLFTKRVFDMVVSSDTTLWMATYDGGLIGLKNGMVTDTITVSEGVTSNTCRSLIIDNDELWAGTDKGVSRINLNSKPYTITTYTVNDGLLSNHINAVYKDGDTVYVASQDGITYFDVTKVKTISSCNLEILSIAQGGKELPLGDSYTFKHNQNNFRIDFIGISFKSTGDITYKYKLEGLDTAMKSTRETTLDFLSLPPGKYVLHLTAINKFGVKSELKKITITINPAFYQSAWFYIGILLATVAVTWLAVHLYNRNRRRREEQERETVRRITELEQMALRAQMNPHFIFNCLNSIQQFVYDKDIHSANRFISGFAKLIRQTLDNSAKTTISVADEVDYLNSYMALEKIRFENKFDYKISLGPGIKAEEYKIPVMLLQPYVENSIRHGIRYKKDNLGKINIQFSLNGNDLICTIEDNGIGREKARELKSRQHIEYQSKGMLLTGERIDALNKILAEKIRIDIVDLYEENRVASGTKIIIYFPLALVQNN